MQAHNGAVPAAEASAACNLKTGLRLQTQACRQALQAQGWTTYAVDAWTLCAGAAYLQACPLLS